MSSGNKRERELARAKFERQQARRAAEANKRSNRNRIVGAVVTLGVVALFVAWFVRTGSSGETPIAAPTDAATATASASPSASNPSPTLTSQVTCTKPPAPRVSDLTWPKAPERKIDPAKPYTLTLDTNCGTIAIDALAGKAPITVNSMAFLAGQDYFNATRCHRLTTQGIYVVQCGDPKGTGQGGPGYQFADENLPTDGANDYPAGSVAMANAGPGTNGSQFFLVWQDTTLPPNYTIWGTITEGLDIVRYVASQGVEGGATDGIPVQPLQIASATMTPAYPTG